MSPIRGSKHDKVYILCTVTHHDSKLEYPIPNMTKRQPIFYDDSRRSVHLISKRKHKGKHLLINYQGAFISFISFVLGFIIIIILNKYNFVKNIYCTSTSTSILF